MKYFAYGLNMSSSKLTKRVGQVIDLGKAYLKDYILVFNKLSKDGSGKANVKIKSGVITEGVLYELDEDQISKLDKREGVPNHYSRVKRKFTSISGEPFEAEIYIACTRKIINGLKPTKGYLSIIIEGAAEHNLSDEYLTFLKSTKFTE